MKDFPADCDVSVVIPCYRCQDTLGRAVESVARQSLRPAEGILVDDASDDGTPALISLLRNRYGPDWIKAVRLPVNRGPAVARNAGWERAEKTYVAFLDADDGWHRDKIRIQFEYMRTHPDIDMTGHRWSRFRETEAESTLPMSYEIRPVLRSRLLISNRLLIGTVMLRRGVAVRFDPSKRYSEDYLFCLQVLYNGYRGEFIDLNLSYMYKDPYGDGGLSRHLWRMELGELDVYRRVYEEGHIPGPLFTGLALWSGIRFARRIVVSLCRRGVRRGDG